MTSTDGYTRVQLEQDVRDLVRLAAEKERIVDAETQIKARIREHVEVGGTVTVDGHKALTVQPNRKFDTEKGLALVPAELRIQCYREVVDPAVVRNLLAPALVETCMVDAGQPRIVLHR